MKKHDMAKALSEGTDWKEQRLKWRKEIKQFQKGDHIIFKAYNYISGEDYEAKGKIMAIGDECKKLYPDELGEADFYHMIVQVEDIFGNTNTNAIVVDDIVKKEE